MTTTYVMEAKESYDAANAANFALATFPGGFGNTSQYQAGISYDAVRRKIMYSLCWSETAGSVLNPTGQNLYSGVHYIDAGNNYAERYYLNFSVMELDLATEVVTRYDAYDPASLVPNGVGLSDGTYRRFVEADGFVAQGIKIVDPRNGDIWSHHFAGSPRTCLLYNFRRADNFALTISPYVPSADRHLEIFGLSDDWLFVGELGAINANRYAMQLIPRVRTADEVTADFLLSYATFNFPAASVDYVFTSVVTEDGNVYLFAAGVPFPPGTDVDYKLWRLAPPTSAPFGGPVVGGGWTDVTPWGAATGPNTLAADFTQINHDTNTVQAMWLHATSEMALINRYYPNDHDPASTSALDFHVQCTYYRPGDLAWSYTGDFVTGYMTSVWGMTAVAADAAYAVMDIRQTDRYRDYNSYDFGDDDTTRWFVFRVHPVVAGAVVTITWRTILVEYRFAFGVAPEVVRFLPEDGWDAAYPAYGIDVGDANVVEVSMNLVPQIDNLLDVGFRDETDGAWWWSGQRDNFYAFDATFDNRSAGSVSAPFLRLSLIESSIAALVQAHIYG